MQLGLVSDYTRDGLLLGHIIQCTVLIGEVGKELGAEPGKGGAASAYGHGAPL